MCDHKGPIFYCQCCNIELCTNCLDEHSSLDVPHKIITIGKFKFDATIQKVIDLHGEIITQLNNQIDTLVKIKKNKQYDIENTKKEIKYKEFIDQCEKLKLAVRTYLTNTKYLNGIIIDNNKDQKNETKDVAFMIPSSPEIRNREEEPGYEYPNKKAKLDAPKSTVDFTEFMLTELSKAIPLEFITEYVVNRITNYDLLRTGNNGFNKTKVDDLVTRIDIYAIEMLLKNNRPNEITSEFKKKSDYLTKYPNDATLLDEYVIKYLEQFLVQLTGIDLLPIFNKILNKSVISYTNKPRLIKGILSIQHNYKNK